MESALLYLSRSAYRVESALLYLSRSAYRVESASALAFIPLLTSWSFLFLVFSEP